MAHRVRDPSIRCPYCGSDDLRRQTAGSLRHPAEVFLVLRCGICGKASKEPG